MTGDTERNIVKNLLRGTFEGDLDWRHIENATPRWNGPIETFFENRVIRVTENGTVTVIDGRSKYPFDAGSMGEDLYHAARENAWNRKHYDDVMNNLDDLLIEEFES